jgi:Polyketide cyclase / dehydrase and lipid transport
LWYKPISTVMTILIIILFIIAIPFIVALFTSNKFKVEKEVTINKPKQQVFDYVKQIKNQDNFAVWMSLDPAMKRQYSGTDGTVGFVSEWDSNHKQVGAGRQTITGIKEGEQVAIKLEFVRPWKNVANVYFKTDAVSANQTNVKWGFYNNVKYPMKVIRLFMNMEKMTGKDFEKGLTRLKEVIEK